MINILNPFRKHELCTYKGSQAIDLHIYASITVMQMRKTKIRNPELRVKWDDSYLKGRQPFWYSDLGISQKWIQLVVRRWVAYNYRKMNPKTLRQGISCSLKRSGVQTFADLYDWQHLHVAKIILSTFANVRNTKSVSPLSGGMWECQRQLT